MCTDTTSEVVSPGNLPVGNVSCVNLWDGAGLRAESSVVVDEQYRSGFTYGALSDHRKQGEAARCFGGWLRVTGRRRG